MPKGRPIASLLDHFFEKLILGHDGGHWSLNAKRFHPEQSG